MVLACGGLLRSQNVDFRILYDLQQRRTPSADVTMKWVSNSVWLTPLVPAGMAVGGWATDDRTLLNDAAMVGCSWMGTLGITVGTKYLVRRPRPYQAYPDELVPLTAETDYSMVIEPERSNSPFARFRKIMADLRIIFEKLFALIGQMIKK